MENKATFSRALNFTKISVLLVCTWPPGRSATKWQLIVADVLWSLSFLSVFCLILPLVHSIHQSHSDSFVLSQSLCYCFACATIIVKTLVLRIHRTKMQAFICDMEDFFNEPKKANERRILRCYVERCWTIHALITFMNYLASLMIVLGPLVFPEQPMPTAATYPFSIDSGIVMCLVFVHQSFVGLQCSAALTVDCQMAMLMWYAGARLEILAEEISVNFSAKNFRSFVYKHQEILSYAAQVSGTMCYIALTTVFTCGIASIMCSMQFVGNQPMMVKMQFLPVTIGVLINLMVSALPTENMMRVCDLIGRAMYNAPWAEMSPKFTKDMIMVLQMSQRPVQVSIRGFLPALSFGSYASFLSGVFSYFTTLRVLIMSEDEK